MWHYCVLPIYTARFIVHVRAPHVVALQNKKQSELYLRAEPHKLTHAAGNSKCNFIVKDNGRGTNDDQIE